MSLQRECAFIEPEPNKWYYLIDNSNIAHQWDWRENAECFGPFPSEEAANNHLSRTQANPGGSWTTPHSEYKPDDVLSAAIARAESPNRDRQRPYLRGRLV